MKSILSLVAAAALLPAASAHYIFGNLIVGNNYTGTYEYVRKNSNINSPLTDVTSTDMRCNTGAQASAASTGIYTVAAGSTVGMGVSYGGSVIHPGPLQVYLSKAPSGQTAATYDGSGDWFKIYEEGTKSINSTGMYWYSDGGVNFTWTLPSTIPSGDYLMRVEHIALHTAETYPGAQFYVECAQLRVTGGSASSVPGPTVKIPGVYTGAEPGITISIFYPIPSCYPFPGPVPWPAGASNSFDNPACGTGSTATSSTKAASSPATSKAATTSKAAA